MSTKKNITMKEFNGTDYDILYPKTIATQIPDVYSQTEILTTETLSKYGLTSDKLPNDVFQQIKTLIDNAQASADGKAKIQTGSYVGTGTYGANNPCSLTFDFVPYVIMILGGITTSASDYSIYIGKKDNSYYGQNAIILSEVTTSYQQYKGLGIVGYYSTAGSNYCYGKKSVDGKTYYWYSNADKITQYNDTKITYWYMAIG